MSRWNDKIAEHAIYLENFISKRYSTEAQEELFKKEHNGRGMFEYIPLTMRDFLEQMNVAMGFLAEHPASKYPDGIHFIDVGCGIGGKVKLAYDVFGYHDLRITGIEYAPHYVEIAQQLCQSKKNPKYGPTIIQGDARKHDYSTYHIVYFYCPMMDHDGEVELEKQIFSTIRKNTIVIANGMKTLHKEVQAMGMKNLWGRNHWVKAKG